MLPGSQNAFLSFFLSEAAESRRSILLSSSEEDIFAPARPERLSIMVAAIVTLLTDTDRFSKDMISVLDPDQ